MWNDNETIQDLIDFKYLIDSVNSIINNDDLIPSTIGIYGDWGSGKSSLMNMIAEENNYSNNLVIKFNGWLFEGYEDAKVALLSSLIDEIIKNRKWNEKAKTKLSKLIKSVKWLKSITALSKYGLNGYLASQGGMNIDFVTQVMPNDEFQDYFRETENEKDSIIENGIKDFHKNFGELLKETNINRIIVMIDDLDRCDPATVISTLEAIKLFLFVEKSVFIISADERLINYAVKKKFPELPSSDYDVSKDYIEKLIHFPIRIPSLSEAEYETYLNLLLSKLHLNKDKFEKLRSEVIKRSNDDLSQSKLNYDNIIEYLEDPHENHKNDLILTKQINSILVSVLSGNPRQCKRFLNMLMLRLNMAKSKGISLKKNVLAKIMLLEYFKTESFNKLVKESYKSEKNLVFALEKTDLKESSAFDEWQNDEWLKNWLELEPKLGEEDLNLYFYFTRNKNIGFSVNKRLSNEAKEILKDILDNKLLVKNAIEKSGELNDSDINALFSEFKNKFLIEEEASKRNEISKLLVQFVKKHDSLLSEFLAFFENAPDDILSPANIPQLISLTKNTTFISSSIRIIEKWSKSSNSMLSKAANKKL